MHRTIGLFLIIQTIFSGLLLAQPRPDEISLNGEWQFCKAEPLLELAPKRTPKFDPPTLSPDLAAAIAERFRDNPESHLPETADWQAIRVPASWELTAGIDYNGAGWYRRNVDIDENLQASGKRIWIEFDAIATVAGVWLNGEWLGGHVGDYVRWRVEATGAVRGGGNDLLIYVDELPGHITQGFLCAVAPHHGGIWQNVRLFATGQTSIATDGVHIVSDRATGNITVSINTEGPESGGSQPEIRLVRRHVPPRGWQPIGGSAELQELNYTRSKPENQWRISATIPEPAAWHPDHPALYELEITVTDNGATSDRLRKCFAFRDVEIRGTELRLNGELLKIRSILNWGYYPRVVAPAPPLAVVEDEFKYLKSLGFNAQTICLMVMPDDFYDLADETGMLIWNEYPTWHNDFTAERLPTYRRVFPAYYRRDRHHPAIILRSISVEAGVKDQSVMRELVDLTKEMTDTPVQDNNSWIWMSNIDLTDWYGDDNYWNNPSWAQYYLFDLPEKMAEMPVKPYIMGETIAGTVWIDSDTLASITPEIPLSGHLYGNDDPHAGEDHPYWFPLCYQACVDMEFELRERYNQLLAEGEDIVRDYLMPQSHEYGMAFRRFQVKLLHADPRYRGYTLFLLRDLPQIRSGFIDDAGQKRFTPEEWSWHGEQTVSPVMVAGVSGRDAELPLVRRVPELSRWDPQTAPEITRDASVRYLSGGYSDMKDLFRGWPNASSFSEKQLAGFNDADAPPVLVSDVLLRGMIPYLEGGGTVILFPNRWPGGLGSQPAMVWANTIFAPPAGPLTERERTLLLDLHQFDLIQSGNQVLPSSALDIAGKLDPLLRAFSLHNNSAIGVQDQLAATRIADGLLIVTTLDHSTDAGQWLLGRISGWAEAWQRDPDPTFPVTRLSVDEFRSFAVDRINIIMQINDNWRFMTDPQATGEDAGWMRTDLDESEWDTLQAARLWEGQGYRYDGIGWYRRTVTLPDSLAGRTIILVAEGVDDAYKLYIDGEYIAQYGSFSEHSKSVHVTRTETDVTGRIIPGKTHQITLQVIDLYGGGGIGRPIYFRVE